MAGSQSTSAKTVFKVFLFTDIVGSIDLKKRLGDAVAADAIGKHDALFRQFLKQYSGTEEDNAGDGFFAIFDLPSDAVRCALAFQRGLADLDVSERLNVRIGIHMGEIVSISAGEADRGEDKLVGLAVDTAARVMGLAQGGQILTTRGTFDSARQQLSSAPDGSPLQWLAHGPYLFQGLDDPLEVFEVGIEAHSPLAPPPDSEKAKRGIAPGDEETLGWRPAAGLTIPRRENWLLQEKIGEGGYGEVWLAAQEKTKEKRIFKFCFDPERVRGLRREVVLFRLLRETLGERDDIVRILDWQFDKPPYFLESEYTAAGDLVHWAESKGGLAAVPLETRLELVAQAAVALGAAHSVGVLHKDVKPSNILITEIADRGEPRAGLTDFGIGLITNREALQAKGITAAGLTQTLFSSSGSSQSGTRLYMAPEVIEGKPATTLSDVYALGVLLYQIVVGDFSRSLASGWERDISHELLREDIRACVDGNPEHRLQGASELAHRLESLDERLAVRKSERKAKAEAERWMRRRRVLTVGTAVAAVLIVGISVIALRERRRADEEAALRVELADALGTAETESARAEENFRQARGVVDDFFTRISQSALLNEPTMQPLRRELLESALEYYTSFAATESDDPQVRAELAAASLRVYEIANATAWRVNLEPLTNALRIVQGLRTEGFDLSSAPSLARGTLTGHR
ncbi:protein kinase, partial [Candidatus Sumerlaeota bacterium]|nr:protein kinase [Candidatus Sumerlaeota bacterium]